MIQGRGGGGDRGYKGWQGTYMGVTMDTGGTGDGKVHMGVTMDTGGVWG